MAENKFILSGYKVRCNNFPLSLQENLLEFNKCWCHYLEILLDSSSVWQIQTVLFFIFEEMKGKTLEIKKF